MTHSGEFGVFIREEMRYATPIARLALLPIQVFVVVGSSGDLWLILKLPDLLLITIIILPRHIDHLLFKKSRREKCALIRQIILILFGWAFSRDFFLKFQNSTFLIALESVLFDSGSCLVLELPSLEILTKPAVRGRQPFPHIIRANARL